MYVITLDEEVIITEQIYDHSMLGRGEPVLVAGDVYLKKVNGVLQIERIDNRSGSYMSEIFLDENYPKNIAHLPHLVESKFIEIGFLEAKGKYQEFLTPEQQLSFLLEKAEEDFESLSSKEKAYVNKLKSHASSEEVPLLKREMEPYSKFNFFRSGTTPNSSVIAPKITLKID